MHAQFSDDEASYLVSFWNLRAYLRSILSSTLRTLSD